MIVIPFWILKSFSSGFNVIKDEIIKILAVANMSMF